MKTANEIVDELIEAIEPLKVSLPTTKPEKFVNVGVEAVKRLFCDNKDLIVASIDKHASQFKPQWISVEDILPENDERVLCALKSGTHWNSFSYWVNPNGGDGLFLNYDYPFGNKNITHWMPLPEPPQK